MLMKYFEALLPRTRAHTSAHVPEESKPTYFNFPSKDIPQEHVSCFFIYTRIELSLIRCNNNIQIIINIIQVLVGILITDAQESTSTLTAINEMCLECIYFSTFKSTSPQDRHAYCLYQCHRNMTTT